jgi:hypothetical protein
MVRGARGVYPSEENLSPFLNLKEGGIGGWFTKLK